MYFGLRGSRQDSRLRGNDGIFSAFAKKTIFPHVAPSRLHFFNRNRVIWHPARGMGDRVLFAIGQHLDALADVQVEHFESDASSVFIVCCAVDAFHQCLGECPIAPVCVFKAEFTASAGANPNIS